MSGFNNGDPATNGEYALLKHLGNRISVFADIGYNHGDASNFISKIKSDVRVVGFEPNPELAAKAKHKIFMTALSDIFFCPKDYGNDKFKQMDIPNEFSTTKFLVFE